MSELHKFLFDGLPVRGMVVRLTEAWTEVLARRASNNATGAYPPPVVELLGEMTAYGIGVKPDLAAAAVLYQQAAERGVTPEQVERDFLNTARPTSVIPSAAKRRKSTVRPPFAPLTAIVT